MKERNEGRCCIDVVWGLTDPTTYHVCDPLPEARGVRGEWPRVCVNERTNERTNEMNALFTCGYYAKPSRFTIRSTMKESSGWSRNRSQAASRNSHSTPQSFSIPSFFPSFLPSSFRPSFIAEVRILVHSVGCRVLFRAWSEFSVRLVSTDPHSYLRAETERHTNSPTHPLTHSPHNSPPPVWPGQANGGTCRALRLKLALALTDVTDCGVEWVGQRRDIASSCLELKLCAQPSNARCFPCLLVRHHSAQCTLFRCSACAPVRLRSSCRRAVVPRWRATLTRSATAGASALALPPRRRRTRE